MLLKRVKESKEYELVVNFLNETQIATALVG